MSDSLSAPAASLDQTLVNILSERLDCEVSLVEHVGPDLDWVLSEALANTGKAAICDHAAAACTIGLKLPLGGVATWQSEPTRAAQSAAYAETVLALQTALNEKNQLQAEAEALATQVVNDFEELSLIRSLASSMELPSSGVGVNEVALNSLRPLASGVGAVSIAAVFLSEDGEEMAAACWSGEAVTSNQSLHRLIREHRQEAATQPVVRNTTTDSKQTELERIRQELTGIQ